MNNEELKRYNRHLILPEIGNEGQEKLKNASVFVVGAGGLGCPALLYLAAAGVGKIGIADFDTVDISNLQRQVLYTTEDIGLSKAAQAKKRIQLLNPLVDVSVYTERLDNKNILEYIKSYDIIIDGSDNFATRYLVNDACVILDKPLVYGSIFKFEGQVSVFNYKNGPTYRCIFPEPPGAGEVPNCSEIGVLGVLPGMIGTMQANEAIKIITGIGNTLSGKLLLFNALNMEFNTISFSLVPENKNITHLIDYELFCGNENKYIENELTADELRHKLTTEKDLFILDVRNPDEYERFNIGGILIPLPELESLKNKIPLNKEIVVICQSGKRSLIAIEKLKDWGHPKLFNLTGGLNKW